MLRGRRMPWKAGVPAAARKRLGQVPTAAPPGSSNSGLPAAPAHTLVAAPDQLQAGGSNELSQQLQRPRHLPPGLLPLPEGLVRPRLLPQQRTPQARAWPCAAPELRPPQDLHLRAALEREHAGCPGSGRSDLQGSLYSRPRCSAHAAWMGQAWPGSRRTGPRL